MIHFHNLEVSRVEKETDDCVSITFNVPDDLKELFLFSQGQSLTLRKVLDGEERRRTYSICAAPHEDELKIAVKQVSGGVFSTYANTDLQSGDILEVMPPIGNFYTPTNQSNKKKYLAIAAGSGITPVISIIKATLQNEPLSEFTLIYGNRTRNSIIFREQLEGIKDLYLTRFRTIHILSREKTEADINHGRIDREKLNMLFSKVIDTTVIDDVFLCGPEELIFTAKDVLEQKGLNPSKVHFELFTIPGQAKSVADTPQDTPALDAGPVSQVRIKLDGIQFEIDVTQSGESILDAALKTGADLPYACKGGVCTTCKARLMKGEVRMDVNWGLEPDEIEKGFILTCQSHPITDEVSIDFDKK